MINIQQNLIIDIDFYDTEVRYSIAPVSMASIPKFVTFSPEQKRIMLVPDYPDLYQLCEPDDFSTQPKTITFKGELNTVLEDRCQYKFNLTGTDGIEVQIIPFTLIVRNQIPYSYQPICKTNGTQNFHRNHLKQKIALEFVKEIAIDEQEDTMSYNLTWQNGSEIPSWLSLNTNQFRIQGTPSLS